MDPNVWGKLLTHHRRGYGVDVEALHGWFPLRRSIDEGSKMGLADTKGYGGGNSFLWSPLMFLAYIGIYRWKKYIGGRLRGPQDRGRTQQGGCPPPSWPPRLLLDLHSKSSRSRSFRKSRSRRFHSVWTPFDILFLRNSEIGKKTAILGWASG